MAPFPIRVTLTNIGTANASITVVQDGNPVAGSPFIVTPGVPVLVDLPQTEDVPTQIDVDSGAFHADLDFTSDCLPPPPVAIAEPEVDAVECQPGILVTLTNGGNLAATFTITQDGNPVAGSPFVVAGPGIHQLTLPQVEDVPTQVVVDSASVAPPLHEVFDFTSDCAPPPGGGGPGPVVVPPVVPPPVIPPPVVPPPVIPPPVVPPPVIPPPVVPPPVLPTPPVIPPVTPPVIPPAPRRRRRRSSAPSASGSSPWRCAPGSSRRSSRRRPQSAPRPTVEVDDRVVARSLPRTGTSTLPLLETGLGMILLGVGALLFGRERTVRL